MRRWLTTSVRWLAQLGQPMAAVLLASLLGIVSMYCRNDNYDKDPSAERGDGRYRPILARGDGHMLYLITRSLVFDRDVNFDNDLARFGDPWNQPRTKTGRKTLLHQFGPALVLVPVLAAADGLAAVVNVFGGDIPRHGYTMFHQRIVFASSVVAALATTLLTLWFALRLWGGRAGPVLAVVSVLLGTSIVYYSTYMPSYSHALDAFFFAAFFVYWGSSIGRMDWRRFVIIGLLLGFSVLMRPNNLLAAVALVFEGAVVLVGGWKQRQWRPLLRFCAGGAVVIAITAVMYVPQLLVWKQMYGEYFVTPQGPGYVRLRDPLLLETLFAAKNGWLSNMPINYAGCVGLIVWVAFGKRLWPTQPRLIAVSLLVIVALHVYVNACVYDWWAGASFGQRRMTVVTAAVALGLVALLRATALLLLRATRRVKSVRWRKGIGIGARVLGIATLVFFIEWNMGWVKELRSAAPAGRDGPTCCDDAPKSLRWLAEPVYRLVGNPFEFPANAWFALKHNKPLVFWDHAVGQYPLVPPFLEFESGRHRNFTAQWSVMRNNSLHHLYGFGEEGSDPAIGRFRSLEPEAKMLLPLLVPEPHRVRFSARARSVANERDAAINPAAAACSLKVEFNGDLVLETILRENWAPVEFVTDGSIGETTVWFGSCGCDITNLTLQLVQPPH